MRYDHDNCPPVLLLDGEVLDRGMTVWADDETGEVVQVMMDPWRPGFLLIDSSGQPRQFLRRGRVEVVRRLN